MTALRNSRLFTSASLLSLALVAGGACKKNEDKKEPTPATGSNAKPGETKPTTADKPNNQTAEAPVASGDDLTYVPNVSDVVGALDLGKFRSSEFYKSFVEAKLREALEKDGKYAKFKSECQMDPIAEISKVTFGVKPGDDNKASGVVVVHGLDKAKSMACLEKNKDKPDMGAKIDGDYVMFDGKGDAPGVGRFISDDTAVLQFGDGATKDTLAAILKGEGSIAGSQAFMDLYGKTKEGAFRFFANGSMKQLANNPMGFKPKAVFGTFDASDGVRADVRVRTDSPETAASTAKMADGQVGMIRSMVTKAGATADGADVVIEFAANADQLKAMVTQFAPMMGR